MDKGAKKWIALAFALYGAAMAWLLFGQRLGMAWPSDYWTELTGHLNLVPLRTVRHFIRLVRDSGNPFLIRFARINLLGNVWVFVPLGVFMPWLWPPLRRFWRFALCFLAVTVAVELVQLVTLLGSCDVDDVILNFVGGSLGYGLFLGGRRLWAREKK